LLGGMEHVLSNKSEKKIWEEFCLITAKIKSPVYNVQGGCNLKRLSVHEDKSPVADEHFSERYKKKNYVFKYKNNLFIGFDSDDILNAQYASNEDVSLLKQALNDGSKYNNIFLATQNSPGVAPRFSNKWSEIIRPLFEGKTGYIFSAGARKFNSIKEGGISYINVNSAPYLKDLADKNNFSYFLLVDVNKKNVSIKVIPLSGIPIGALGSRKAKKSARKALLLPEPVLHYTVDSPERNAILSVERIIETLNIKPGMNVLDLGAGNGLFTFGLARHLQGTGSVFATEIDSKMVDAINEKAKELKYDNVTGVLVQPQKVDDFYRQHVFDIIFLCEVYHYLWDPTEYLRQLKNSLKKDTGRLYIIYFKNVSMFSEVEFGDFNKVFRVLRSENDTFPVFRGLNKKARDFVRNWDGGSIPAAMQAEITADLNAILTERRLFIDLLDYYNIKYAKDATEAWGLPVMKLLYPDNRALVKWLIAQLDEGGIFKKNSLAMTDAQKQQLIVLNRTLLSDILGTSVLYYLKGAKHVYLNKKSIISVMEEAGYQFVKDHDFMKYHYFLEFKRK